MTTCRTQGHPLISSFKRVSALLPTACIVCGRIVSTTFLICGPCSKELPWIRNACVRCGESTYHTPLCQELCNKCQLPPPGFQFCKGLFLYLTPVDTLLSGFKFHARFDAGFALAAHLAERMYEYYALNNPPDLLLPVPLHDNRLRARGYNQAAEIAKTISARCGIPISTNLVKKRKDTIPQTEIGDATARLKNLRNAFYVPNVTALRNVKRIAIIDDVVTTMATVMALTDTLRLAGIDTIEVWCIARASR